MISSEDWAYLAGIIDGEGTIQLSQASTRYNGGNNYKYMIRIYNTDTNLIEWIHERFSGNVRVHNRGKVGEAFGKKPIHMVDWRNVDDIGDILQGVMPYLVVKRDLAETLMGFIYIPQWEKEMRKIVTNKFKEARDGG